MTNITLLVYTYSLQMELNYELRATFTSEFLKFSKLIFGIHKIQISPRIVTISFPGDICSYPIEMSIQNSAEYYAATVTESGGITFVVLATVTVN